MPTEAPPEPKAPQSDDREPDAAAIDSADTEHGESLDVEAYSGTSILVPARYGFENEQVVAIKKTVAKDCTDAELVMFLEVAARYRLDPFAKHIFAAKIKGAVQIIVSRDGLLHHAMRQPDFQGISGDVVHENDKFAVGYKNGKRNIEHSYTLTKDGRGKIVGAWAQVERGLPGDEKGTQTTFFFAPLDEYQRSGDGPWKSHPSAMILKVAEVYALRKAYSVSGVVGEDEMSTRPTRAQASLTQLPAADYGDDPELADRLKGLVEQAQEISASDWRPQKVVSRLDGADQESREAFANELADWIAEHDVAEPEEEAVDAEVVPDGEE